MTYDQLPIVERIFNLTEMNAFHKKYILNFNYPEYPDYLYFIVYIDGHKPTILFFRSGTENRIGWICPKGMNVAEGLSLLPSHDYHSMLLFASFYLSESADSFYTILRKSSELYQGTYYDYVFAPTYGFMAFAEQFSELYRIFTGAKKADADQVVVDWNLNRYDTRATIRNTADENGFLFRDVIQNRFFNGAHYVFRPNYKAAHQLLALLHEYGLLKPSILSDIKSRYFWAS